MAKATWSREPAETPPATFTLELNESEALDVLADLGVGERAYVAYRVLFDALKNSGRTDKELYDL